MVAMVADHRSPEIMDASSPAAAAMGADDPPRMKFLCSAGGSILPRPLDGKLRYVGGETRIVCLPRDVGYEELMARVRELFDGTWTVKYQQPDEDLDALVSVVNDDDVTNMMEEYDKLGAAGEGFTRLRIFLFPLHQQGEHDGHSSSPQFDVVDERETERRYVDALNSLSDGKSLSPDAAAEHFFAPTAADIGVYGHQFNNLHRLTIPRLPSHGQIYSEMEGPWSPATGGTYYSPGHLTPHDPREFPPSPSSGRYGVGDLSDRNLEEYVRHSPAHQLNQYEHHSPFLDSSSMVWFPPGGIVGEMAGFPGNLGHSHSFYDGGSSICEHCRVAVQRNQVPVAEAARYHDPRWKHGQPHMEHLGSGSDIAAQFSDSCIECVRQREAYLLNKEMRLEHGVCCSEQSDQRHFYNELHGQDRNWVLHHPHHQVTHHLEETRGHRNEPYVMDGNGMNFPFARGSLYNGHLVPPPNCIGHNDPRYTRPGTELGSEMYHDQHAVGAGNTSAYGVEGLYQVPYGSSSIHVLRRNVQAPPVCHGPSYEAPGLTLPADGAINTGYARGTPDGSPKFCRIGDSQLQDPWAGHNAGISQKIFPLEGTVLPENYHDYASKTNPGIPIQENRYSAAPESIPCQPPVRLNHGTTGEAKPLAPSAPCLIDDKTLASPPPVNGIATLPPPAEALVESNLTAEANETKQQETKELNMFNNASPKENLDVNLDSDGPTQLEGEPDRAVLSEPVRGPHQNGENIMESITFLPELISSIKKAVLEDAEEVKSRAHADHEDDSEHVNGPKDLEVESDGEQHDISKIESTTAEMEVLAKGLQVIKNGDLEEIRALGSGAYGSVYHGKWKGSDVAIKRIKASCFNGKPSERERLIADFWKEAWILSSVHHPNVVSFYGVVRDGPDGTLATVTEFMINGSLKQFLQKKDRTIDRRKRLIIAMDAAFGMEYLHGKNIVHFDLKCENLLVNMRDPHRPVCKIGDLGLSKVKQHTLVSGGVRGTLPWMAPELLSGKTNMVTEKIDVYSFGIVMWELLTGEDPYTDMHCASIIGGIVNNTLRPQVPNWCDPEWKSLMESCWSSDPGERPSFSEISQKLRKMAAAINVK